LLFHYIILHPSKIGNSFVIQNVLAIFCSLSKTISLAKQGGNNGNSWLTNVQKTQVSTNRKNLLRARIIGNHCNVLLQGSSHVMFLLMFILFVLRQKSEKNLDIHLYVYMSFCFICYWFYLCRIVLSMIVILEILELRFIHFLQNTSWIYTVPSIPCCLWLTGFFIGSMIISIVQFLWSHRYLVVTKYMSYVAVYTLYVGIWLINCDIYSFDWKCIQYNDSVFTILKGVREDIYVHVRSLPCKVIN